ncbi:alpha/beta hydrolase [Aquimarina rhabdastrellae]
MKQLIIFWTLLFIITVSYGQGIPHKISETEFSIGKTITIKSEILNENRTLNVYLPLSYTKEKSKKYPVIYVLDGSKDEDFIHISGIVQFGSFSWINMLPESIVVGIANVDRKRDFTYPSQYKRDQEEFPTSGKSAHFINFIKNELQPFIDTTYRITTTKTIIGQSFGGLLVTEILFKKPDLFDNYIIVSPSLWWDEEKLLDIELSTYHTKKAIYIAGGKEGEVMERTAKELYNKLKENKKENTKLFYEFMEDKTHGDALHIAVYNAFEKIFKSKKKKQK